MSATVGSHSTSFSATSTVGLLNQIAFSGEPSGGNPAYQPITTQPIVTFEDSSGNVESSGGVPDGTTVTITQSPYQDCHSDSAAGLTNNTATSSSGAASFSGLTFNSLDPTTIYLKATATVSSETYTRCSQAVNISAPTANPVYSTATVSAANMPGDGLALSRF